jgi:hypothetical protein
MMGGWMRCRRETVRARLRTWLSAMLRLGLDPQETIIFKLPVEEASEEYHQRHLPKTAQQAMLL